MRTFHVALADPADAVVTDGMNLAGEPRDEIAFAIANQMLRPVDASVVAEYECRGAWARSVQLIGALDAAADSSVRHCRERVQFGRPLSKLQSVQHTLAVMAGDIERARAAVTLAVAAATDFGFGDNRTEYAVSVARDGTGPGGRCGDRVPRISCTARWEPASSIRCGRRRCAPGVGSTSSEAWATTPGASAGPALGAADVLGLCHGFANWG